AGAGEGHGGALGGRAGPARVSGRVAGGYSSAIMFARGVARPLLAVRPAWRRASGFVARQLITGNRRVALLLAVVTAFISVAAVYVSQSAVCPAPPTPP